MTATVHFDQRCRERGIVSVNPADLRGQLEAAVRRGADDFAEYVMHRRGNPIYRFRLPEGVFYVVICAKKGRAITLLTQAMIRGYKTGDRNFIAGRKKKRRKAVPE